MILKLPRVVVEVEEIEMSYEDKLDAIRNLIEQHNEKWQKHVDFSKFRENLCNAGGTNEEVLKLVSFEDLEKFGLPLLLAKQAASIFRKEPNQTRRVFSDYRVGSMNVRELLEHYDPKEDNKVSSRLKELSKSQPCIVFHTDGRVNVDASEKIISEIRNNEPARHVWLEGDTPRKIYPVGQRPNEMVDENPLFAGQRLRSDQTCGNTNFSWEGVSLQVRQLLWIARHKTAELNPKSIDDFFNLITSAKDENAFAKFGARYQKAALMFDEMQHNGHLPSLRIAPHPHSSAAANPFFS